ncbi:DNA polymerase III subunit delta' [Citricoccus sp. SGAir0253]|uniref:DNA polymerase III subunit delta' n=1 Tax=Citricoccus sp. SGAir0253 TaxID=2567881 RepID=UPI0010CCD4B3|nr:DNA polymerase III subunit delta' [Citricoccus sp. SGAir0253]QCU78822.1 DNA polymerase III subunit delta' [Citricoccus sp. SGAir0253]
MTTPAGTVPGTPAAPAPVWGDLAGQQAAVEQLSRAAAAERPTHAWLFTGPPGSGRSNAARAFAQALQCEVADPAGRGCGTCHACLTVAAGTHPDVKVLATENVTYRIDEVRELIALAQDRPVGGRWRIFIMEDADRMTERATNVLLKAIEEPPERTLWMLCAPSPADVLVTIRSRCRQVGLRIPSVESVAQLLVERDGLDPELALFAARASQSHVGMARRLARDEGARSRREAVVHLPLRIRATSDAVAMAKELVEVTQAEAAASAEVRNAEERRNLLRSLGLGEDEKVPPKLRHHVKRLEDAQAARNKRSVHDTLDRAMIDLTGLFRDVLALQLGTEAPLVNEHLRDELASYARSASPERTVARIDAVATARRRLAGNVPPLLALEAMATSFLPDRILDRRPPDHP